MRAPDWSAKLGVGVLVIAALGIGRLVGDELPDVSDSSAPFLRHAAVAEEVELRAGTVRVSSVEMAPLAMSSTEGYLTPGLWLLVTFDYTPREQPGTIRHTRLHDAEGTRSWDQGRGRITCTPTPPGLPSRCAALIEAPAEALVGSTLQLGANLWDIRYDDLAVIDLGITEQDVTAAQEREDWIEVPRPTVGVRRG